MSLVGGSSWRMLRQMPALARRAATAPSAIDPETSPAHMIFLTASGAPLVPPLPRGRRSCLEVSYPCGAWPPFEAAWPFGDFDPCPLVEAARPLVRPFTWPLAP